MIKSEVIKKLNLAPLEGEGGFFRRVYESQIRFDDKHLVSSAIYYLLGQGDKSLMHRLKSEEYWCYSGGVSLSIHVIYPDGRYAEAIVGPLEDTRAVQMFRVPAGVWFGAESHAQTKDEFTLISSPVTPEFIFDDFELAEQAVLLKQYGQHQALIKRLSLRGSDPANGV